MLRTLEAEQENIDRRKHTAENKNTKNNGLNHNKKGKEMDFTKKTVADLVSLGLVTLDQPKVWERRYKREKAKAETDKFQKRANQAVAYYIGMTWKAEQEYRVKATELAITQYGITRRQLEVAMRELQNLGYLENNKDTVSNNCHVKWKLITQEKDIPLFGSL